MTPQKLGPYQAGDEVEVDIDIATALGAPADLTNITPHVYIAQPHSEDAVLSTDGPDPGIVATAEGSAGDTVTVLINSGATEDLRGTYEWRCVLEDLMNRRQLVARGYVDFFAPINTAT